VAVNPVTDKVYLANANSATVTVITEASVPSVPLDVAITPLASDTATTPSPTFNLTATTSFSPCAPAVQGVHYQLDTWQGPWSGATPTGGGNFSATTPALQAGLHFLYAYATDAQVAGSTNTGHTPAPWSAPADRCGIAS
jgi:hypothetical protein